MKISVLFVCLGNICRSPLAMNLFKQEVKNRRLSDHFEIDSCGTSNYHIGEGPDTRTIANAKKNGLDMSHSARQFTAEDFVKFDYILVMDKNNLANVQALDPQNKFNHKVYLMREFDSVDKGSEVPDPYFGGEEGFQNVYEILQRSVKNLLDHIEKEKHLSFR